MGARRAGSARSHQGRRNGAVARALSLCRRVSADIQYSTPFERDRPLVSSSAFPTMRTRVKICGITRVEDARAAAAAGADAIGIVFDPKSARYVETARAREIANAAPPFVTVVGLFVDASPEVVRETLQKVPLSLLQFHGAETSEYCRSFGRSYLKAIRMRDGVDVAAEAKRFGDAVGLLLDAYVANQAGGAGVSFDWSVIPAKREKPIVLAGGLTPQNVANAIRRVRPDAVDVSSGVEVAKGIKDTNKINAFIDAVRNAV